MIKNEDEIKKIKSAIKIIEKTYEKINKNFSN
jgi:Xaa-Pro aminopeptidase